MYYVIVEKIRDGEYEYYGTCIMKLEEGEEPSAELFLKKIYEEEDIKFDDYANAWQRPGDYRYIDIYHWIKIESEEDKLTLNKYGIY